LQMGVDVVVADKPLSDALRRNMQLVGSAPEVKAKLSAYDAALQHDAAPFDSVPGLGFNSDSSASAIVPPPGRATGSGPILVVDPAQNNAFRAIHRAWKEGGKVQASADASGVPVRYALMGLPESVQNDLVSSLALKAERTAAAPGRAINKPRLGIYEPWNGSIDAGWTRWVLEQYGFAFTAIQPEDFKSPLAEKIDVLIMADDTRVPIAGAPAGGRGRGGPVRPEYGYQLTGDDLASFERFIRSGGTLVCLGNASAFAIDQFKLPVKNVVAGLRPEEFFLRGSIVEVNVDRAHPVMAGMPERAAVFVDGSPVFEPNAEFKGAILARYGDAGSPLLSGFIIGEKFVQGKAAAVDAALGDGHVVLIGFRPQWRGQPFGTFRVLFNAALYAR
jgi:hypothetical protein